MAKPRIENKIIEKIHGLFNELREESSRFYKNTDQSLIRFNFVETPTFYQFRVKFSDTNKMIKFFVNKEFQESVEFVQYEKTWNIVLDIDEIYRTRHRDYINPNADLKDRIQKLYLWGIRASKRRRDSIYRAPAVELPLPDQRGSMRDDTLYYGIITDFKKMSETDGAILVDIELLNGNHFIATCNPVQYEGIMKNKFLIVNWMGRFNVLSFTSAKHHLVFEASDYRRITKYLEDHPVNTSAEVE